MGGLDEVLERLVVDPTFRAALAADPASALAGYELSDDDLELLSSQLIADTGGESAVEQRVSKAGVAGLFGMATGHGPTNPGGTQGIIIHGHDGDNQGIIIHGHDGGTQGIVIHGVSAHPVETAPGPPDQPGLQQS